MQDDSVGQRAQKREQHVEDLDREEQGTDEPEIVGANLQGGGSGSGGECTDLSYKQVQEAD